MASLDEYFKKRMGAAQTPTETASDSPDAPADPAKSYIDRISQTLGGKDPVVQNARQAASTKNAVGDYLASRQAKQESVSAGYSPGTLQSQRTADRYQAGANETALARDAGVNDVARERTDTAMSQANQLRVEGNQQTERLRQEKLQQDETLRQEGLQEIETLINSVTDPVAKAYLRRIQAAGGDVKGALAGNLGNQTGGTNPTDPANPANPTPPPTPPANPNAGKSFDEQGNPIDPVTGLPRSLTPAEQALQNAKDEVATFYPDLDPNSEEFKQLVRERTGGASEAQLRAITDANKAAKLKGAQDKASSSFNTLTPEETALLLGNTKSFNPMEIPVGAGALNTFKQTDPIVQVGGKLYKPIDTLEWRQGKNRDFTILQAQDGTYLYVDKDGKTTTRKPPTGNAGNERTLWLRSFA